MKLDFSAKITDFDGEGMKHGDKVATLGLIARDALNATFQDEQNPTNEQKVRRGMLAIVASKQEADTEVSVEDVTLIKELIGKAYAPLVVVRAFELIEPKAAT